MSQVCGKLKPYYIKKEQGYTTSLSVPLLTAPYTSTSFQGVTLFFAAYFSQKCISLFSKEGHDGRVKKFKKIQGSHPSHFCG